MTTIINPRRINRTIVVERDSRTLTARVIDALDAPNGMADMLADAQQARDDAQAAQGLSESARNDSFDARDTAVQAAQDADASEINAASSEGVATAAASTAVSARDAAVVARNAAQAWAESPTPPGGAGTESAKTAADRAEVAAQDAENAAASIGSVVRYDAQTLTAPQKAQARDNIDAVAIADLPEVPVEVPLGTIMHFAADTPPGGWLVCDGTAVTALYPDLRTFLIDAGSPYGTSGGNPRLPDLRGEFVRGWDAGRGVDAGRVFGSAQGDALQDHSHLTGAGVPTNNDDARGLGGRFGTVPLLATNKYRVGGEAAGNALGLTSGVFAPAEATPPTAAVKPPDYSAALGGRASTETRPRSVALLPCIRAYASVVNVPGQAEMDHILQQTQVQANAAVAWRRVGKVNVGTGAAVTITGLDLTKETMFVVSYVKNADTAARTFQMRASEDGGASWGPAWGGLSASADWSTGTLRGAIELFSDSANGSVIASSLLSGAGGADAKQFAPGEVVSGGAPVLTPASDTVEFYWSAGSFAASGVGVPEPDCIIIYQRG